MEMLFSTFKMLTSLPAPWNWIISVAVTLGVAGFLFWRTIKFVKRDTVAIRERLGKPILRYDSARYTADQIASQKQIDQLWIAKGENPIYGKPLIHQAGVIVLNPFTHSIQEVSNQERTIQILNYPVMIDAEQFNGFVVSLMATVKMVEGYRWRYRNLDVENQIRAILADRLSVVCRTLGPSVVMGNHEAFKAAYLQLVQNEVNARLTPSQLGIDAAGLPIAPANFPADPLVGSLARYGGYVFDLNIEEIRPMTEGWLPQAVARVGANAHEMSDLLQATKPMTLYGLTQ